MKSITIENGVQPSFWMSKIFLNIYEFGENFNKKYFKIFPRDVSDSCWKIQFQNHPCSVVDNCGITGCGVWRRKIAFDPRFSTFETRFPDKGTNIKRHLTPGALWPSAKGTKVWTQPRFTNKMLLCCLDISRKGSNTNFTWWKMWFYFYFHKSHLLLICGSSCPQIFPILEKPSARSLLVHPMF